MAKTVSFKEDDVNPVMQSLNAGHQISRWSPAETALKVVDWLASAIKLTFSRVHTYDSTRPLLDRVYGDKRAIATPADCCSAVLVLAGNTFVDFFRNGRITESLGASTLKLSFFLAPADRDVFRCLKVVRCHGDLGYRV